MTETIGGDIDIGFAAGDKTKGIRFRRFAGDDDFAVMADVSMRSWKADGIEFAKSSEEFKRSFEHDQARDPSKELLFAEVDGAPVAFAEAWVSERSDDLLKCFQNAHVLPEFRGEGLREALLKFNESALTKGIRDMPLSSRKVVWSWALSGENDWKTILESEGYRLIWHLLEMVRPDLEDVPDAPLPDGLSVREITESDHRKVWEASREAFSGQPWSSEELWDEAHYRQWLESPEFNPELWQIAWDGDEVAGSVQNYIDPEENETFGRKRGHTERVFVIPSWRGKGVAKALLARSLRLLKEKGMTEATLDTEEANVHEAYKVYQKMGFQTVTQFSFFEKQL